MRIKTNKKRRLLSTCTYLSDQLKWNRNVKPCPFPAPNGLKPLNGLCCWACSSASNGSSPASNLARFSKR